MNLPVRSGPFVKAVETVRTFTNATPSVRTLLANRRSHFDRCHLTLPSTVAAGETVTPSARVWDQCERLHTDFAGSFTLRTTDDEATVPETLDFRAEDGGVTDAGEVTFATPGVQYLVAERGGERFVSNPVRVTEDPPDERLYWGDIHLHSLLSDGAGHMAKGLRYGRDVMDLDVVAYTDHDTMGFFIPPSLQRRRMRERYFDRIKGEVERFNDPGEYVTLFGYEWTKQPNAGGHLNVYFDDPEGAELFDSMHPDTDTYEKLWARLREWRESNEGDVLTIPHHSAEAMYPFDFATTEYDDEMAPLVEVYSQWGSSERPGEEGNRYPLAMGQGEVGERGHYAQDALEMGHRVGLMASSDYHGPRPGHAIIHADPHLPSLRDWREDGLGWGNVWRMWAERSYPGGLCAFRAPELTREAVFDALRERRVYGTTQPDRILVDFDINGVAVGEQDSTVDAPDDARDVSVQVAGTAPVARVTVVRNGEAWQVMEGTEDPDADLETYVVEGSWTDDDPITGTEWDEERGSEADVYYVRARQADGGAAWAGPLWVKAEGRR